MEEIYSWVSSIVYYMVFVTMIVHLLPAGKYEKYMRLFAGCILILLVLRPITGGLRLDEKITGLFQSFSFESNAKELTADLEDMEGKRLSAFIDSYESAVKEDISRMASEEGFDKPAVSVEIETRKDSPDFGTIKKIRLVLPEMTEGRDTIDEKTGAEQIEVIEPVRITIENTAEYKERSFAVSAPGEAEPEQIKKMRKDIAGYYQVEEAYVEIKLENE